MVCRTITTWNLSRYESRRRYVLFLVCPGRFRGQAISPHSCGSLHQISHSDQVINCNSKRKHPTNTVCAPVPGFAQHADCFHPSKDLFDTLPFSLTDRISGMAGSSIINGAGPVPGVLRHMRRCAQAPHLLYEFLCVIGLIPSDRHTFTSRQFTKHFRCGLSFRRSGFPSLHVRGNTASTLGGFLSYTVSHRDQSSIDVFRWTAFLL